MAYMSYLVHKDLKIAKSSYISHHTFKNQMKTKNKEIKETKEICISRNPTSSQRLRQMGVISSSSR